MKHYKLLILSVCGLFGLTSCTINVVTPGSSETTTAEESSEVAVTSEIADATSEVTSVDGVTSEEEITSEEASSEEIETLSEETSSNVDTSEDDLTTDPYSNVSEYSFYQDYTPATSYMDAIYRSQHNLMSGSIADQDQAPTIESNQPKSGSNFVKNTTDDYIVNTDGDNVGYNILDVNGNVADTIYFGGAYTTLEQVATYVYAFGETPANHVASTSDKSITKDWDEYGRGNFQYFSCDTDRYPDEPDLPDNYGGEIGSDNKCYYEMDIGTTGTDCDPSYDTAVYNDGDDVTRGAARIVFTYQWDDETHIEDVSERHVFYTYDHYDDFQEYLNYEGGWGTMFGSSWGDSMDYPELASSNF